jgi:magnesium-transporting ATPase (P-type)
LYYRAGTLTENRMTVVEGWFGNIRLDQNGFKNSAAIPDVLKEFIVHQSCINRTAYLVFSNGDNKVLDRPNVIGNKTEGALIEMCRAWGYDYEGDPDVTNEII